MTAGKKKTPDSIRVLFLEDNPDDVELVLAELERTGLSIAVVQVDNLEDFKKKLGEGYDLILSDYALPSGNALEALEARDRLIPGLPFIIVSGTIGEEVAVECMKGGATDYVLKGKLFRLGPVVIRALDEAEFRRQQKKAEEEFQRLFDYSLDMICVASLAGSFVKVNRAFTDILGYAEEELVSRPWIDFVHPEDRAKTDEVLEQKLRNGEAVLAFTNRYRTKAGEYRLLEWTSYPIPEVGMTYAVARDITEIREIESSLRESEKKFRTLVDRAPVALFLHDLSGRIVDVNRTTVERYGYEREELLGMTVQEIDPDFVGREDGGEFWLRLEKEKSLRFLARHRKKDGTVFPVEVNLAPISLKGEKHFFALAEDVSDKEKARSEIERSRKILNETGRLARIGGWDHDLITREAFWTAALYEIIELDPSSPPPGPDEHLDYYPSPDREVLIEAYEKAAETGDPFDLELRVTTAKGNLVWARVYGEPVYEKGRCVRMRGTFQDISVQKRAQEERNRILTLSPNPVCIVGTDGFFKYLNPAWEAVLGYSLRELMARPILEFIHPEDRARARRDLAGLGNKKTEGEFKNRYQHRDGSTRYIEWVATSFPDEGLIYCIGRDVTKHRETEHQVAISEGNYRDLVENINDAIVATNREGVLSYVSPVIEIITGHLPKEVVGRNFAEFLHPEDLEPVMGAFARVLRGELGPMECRLITREGNYRWVRTSSRPILDAEGRPVGITGVITDIDERKRMESALVESEGKYQTLFRQARDGIVLLDRETGTIVDCNPEFERQTGRSLAELQELRIWEIRPPEKIEPARRKFFEIAERGYGGADELELLRPDGSTLPVEFDGRAVELGGKDYIQDHFRDISEKLALRQREEENIRLQKMEAVGRLAGGVAHDFNNLLTAILGFTDIVLDEVPEDSPIRSDLDEIREAARRGGLLTRQLLAFSRRQTLLKKVLDLNELLGGMTAMLATLLGENIEVRLDCAGDLMKVRADAGQLEQVVMNLAINSRDAMPDGGRLSVRTENIALGREDSEQIEEAYPGQFVRLTIEDSGQGMDLKTQQRVFEPFFTTKVEEKGTGLGLSSVYGIVKQHGGWINLYSEPGQGTVFRIYLPGITSPAVAKKGKPGEGEKPEGSGERILMVEDNEGILNSQIRILRRAGYDAIGVGSTADARRILAREKEGFDLLFTDVVLPDGNGLDLAEEQIKKQPGLGILLSSGYTDLKENGARIRELKLPFLQKPYLAGNLLEKIGEILKPEGE